MEENNKGLEPKLPWLTSIPKKIRFSAFTIAFLVLFLAFYVYFRNLDTTIDYIVLGGVFLFIIISIVLPRINYKIDSIKDHNSLSETLFELRNDIDAIKNNLSEIRSNHMNKLESIERSIEPLLRDFDSVREIVKVVQLKSIDHRDLLSNGKLKNLNEDHKGASLMFKALIEREPKNPKGHSNLSYCYEKSGHYKNAIESIDQAIALTLEENLRDLSKYKYHLTRYLLKDYKTSKNPDSFARAIEVFKGIKHPLYIEQASCMPDYDELINYIHSER